MLVIAAVLVLILAVVSLVFIAAAVRIYNRLVMIRADVDRTWADIEVLEKQRYDEIPNLLTFSSYSYILAEAILE